MSEAAVDSGMAAISRDRVHGSGYLARKALGVLMLAAAERRAALAEELATLRPDMPAIAAAVHEAMEVGDVTAVIRRADAERRRIARSAARSLHRKRVATISNSALVARALVYGGPAVTQVVVADRDDEGWTLTADLRAAGLIVEAVSSEELNAEIAVVGCEVAFADGSFVARAGTHVLVERMPTLVLIDRWKRAGTAPPKDLHSDRFELVRGDSVRAPA